MMSYSRWLRLRIAKWLRRAMMGVPNKEAQYIERLRSGSSDYLRAAKKEAEYWGKEFSDPLLSERRAIEQRASRDLGIGLDALSLKKAFALLPVPLEHGLSLACGSGRLERDLVKKKICKSIHGIDISKNAIEEAKKSSQGMPITYEVGDLNKISLATGQYDVVFTQSCLHHIIELEYLARQIALCLKDGGYLWIHDYIGESQFQYSDERISLANRIIESLPEKFRYDNIHQKTIPPVTRRPIGTLASPFEAIRSAEIMSIFLKYFDIVLSYESNAIFRLVCPVGTRSEFNKTEEGRAIVRILMELDNLIIKHKILPPQGGMYLLRKKNFPLLKYCFLPKK